MPGPFAANVDLRRLACFVTVADELSFTHAAQRLGIAQPWLSSQVRKLECDTGMILFERSTRRVELTAAGRELLPHAHRLLSEADRLVSSIEAARRGQDRRLRIGAPTYSFNVDARRAIIARFAEAYLDVEVEIINGWTSQLLESLRAGDIDVAFLLRPFPTAGLRTAVIERVPVSLVCPQGHPAVDQSAVTLSVLRGTTIAVFRRAVNPRLFDHWNGCLAPAGCQLLESPEPSGEAIMSFAQARGVPFITAGWSAHVNLPPGWVLRPIEEPEFDMILDLAMYAGVANPEARHFWDVATQRGDTSGLSTASDTAIHPAAQI